MVRLQSTVLVSAGKEVESLEGGFEAAQLVLERERLLYLSSLVHRVCVVCQTMFFHALKSWMMLVEQQQQKQQSHFVLWSSLATVVPYLLFGELK